MTFDDTDAQIAALLSEPRHASRGSCRPCRTRKALPRYFLDAALAVFYRVSLAHVLLLAVIAKRVTTKAQVTNDANSKPQLDGNATHSKRKVILRPSSGVSVTQTMYAWLLRIQWLHMIEMNCHMCMCEMRTSK